ncbi:hypothetical protein [Bifidobacterium pseudocatenulatum]|nr:hypothetical protein [Bifidobacterium pseudocatenulatum]MDB6519323.1 hypothetical protein [Bifidobacterium pseudocatenulatum]MDB6522790.1 hypothetical protein [Bifidobacterium pseudocatenulatum]MDB6524559.1 hypothetical protein [Bifidobacterium pseudocatenulatum]MDB6526349.1 hypothetical protein [Bifidobacterium pseudocatenulatum]MDB6528192.1 hypothetical protein [Bifidobacterium pseudocatenulatum]
MRVHHVFYIGVVVDDDAVSRFKGIGFGLQVDGFDAFHYFPTM